MHFPGIILMQCDGLINIFNLFWNVQEKIREMVLVFDIG